MKNLKKTLNQRGATLVEYTILIAFLAIACIAALTTLGNGMSSKFNFLAIGLG